ncbi:hypothetical protein AB0L65_59480 [Nonomuraea sp. NPDC052116]|uniref:hypothetical protein n=1 Tax=Nonomuraea sp. NPDC052116 TaxID=3155665 RepID=UPI00343C1715
MAALRRDEQERLINKIAQLKGSQCDSEHAINEIIDEEPKIAGLRRLVPRGQANILAFIALLVSSVTLLENMLGDLKDLKELFDGSPKNDLKMDYYPHRKLHFLSPIKCGGSATMLENNSLVAIILSDIFRVWADDRSAPYSVMFEHIPVVDGRWELDQPEYYSVPDILCLTIVENLSEIAQLAQSDCVGKLPTEEGLKQFSLVGPAVRWKNTSDPKARIREQIPGRRFTLYDML